MYEKIGSWLQNDRSCSPLPMSIVMCAGERVSVAHVMHGWHQSPLHHCEKLFFPDDEHTHPHQILLWHSAGILSDESHTCNLAFVDGSGRQPVGEPVCRERYLICTDCKVVGLTGVADDKKTNNSRHWLRMAL